MLAPRGIGCPPLGLGPRAFLPAPPTLVPPWPTSQQPFPCPPLCFPPRPLLPPLPHVPPDGGNHIPPHPGRGVTQNFPPTSPLPIPAVHVPNCYNNCPGLPPREHSYMPRGPVNWNPPLEYPNQTGPFGWSGHHQQWKNFHKKVSVITEHTVLPVFLLFLTKASLQLVTVLLFH